MLCPLPSQILLALFPLPPPPLIFQDQAQEAFLDLPSFLKTQSTVLALLS